MKSLAMTVLIGLVVAPAAVRASSTTVSSCAQNSESGLCFWTINDQQDNNPPNTATAETFTQLLGINNASTVAGYYGSGTLPDHPNKGITFSVAGGFPKTVTFNPENFPGSAQTQVVGINNLSNATTVGFWVNSAGTNFGFADVGGTYTSVVDPATTGAVNQLLGVNNSNVAAGFYTDSAGNNHAYLYNIGTSTFTPLTLPASFNAVSVTATDVNNAGIVCGFYTDTNGITHAFLDNAGHFTSYEDPNGTDTMFFGLNNYNEVVGSYVGARSGITNGLLFETASNWWVEVYDPNASATPEFGINGTTVNGINDQGYLVGFYSNGKNGVDGFLATPEPSSLALIGLAGLGAGCFYRRKKQSAC